MVVVVLKLLLAKRVSTISTISLPFAVTLYMH